MSEFAVQTLLQTPTVTLRDVACRGSCRHAGAEECAVETQLVLPYRGVFVRHLGRDAAVAEANQVLWFNAGEGYRVSHPLPDGDGSLTLLLDEPAWRELAPHAVLRAGPVLAFAAQRRQLDASTQALAALLRHRLRAGALEPLAAESQALALAGHALGSRGARSTGGSVGRRRLADRAKLLLLSDPARRWTLSEIAARVGGSPVYLTQVFRQVEGVPLYRYQLRLRLARALQLLPRYDDLTALGLDLGFSSHSHFSAAFRTAYGRTPAAFRRAARG